jgi:drug/metabolite transporter (DMT)-like permease
MISFGLLLVFASLSSLGPLCMKMGVPAAARSTSSIRGSGAHLLAALTRGPVIAGIALYVVAALAWLPLISRVRLSVAYPMASLSYVLVVALSAWVLRERVRWRLTLPGLLLIGVGVSFIGIGRG